MAARNTQFTIEVLFTVPAPPVSGGVSAAEGIAYSNAMFVGIGISL